MTLGDRIRFARENAGLTMEELGKKCGTTKQTIYKYETGKVTNIPLDRLEMIAASVGVSAASLTGWEDKENQPTVSDGLGDCNVIRIAGRDGSYQTRKLTDEQIVLFKAMLDQMPDVPDDL